MLAAKERSERKCGTGSGAATTSYRSEGAVSVLVSVVGWKLLAIESGLRSFATPRIVRQQLCVIAAHTLHTILLDDLMPTESM